MTVLSAGTDLVPGVWPQTAGRSADGVLEIGGLDVRKLARQFG